MEGGLWVINFLFNKVKTADKAAAEDNIEGVMGIPTSFIASKKAT